MILDSPSVIEENSDYAVVFKPSKMHSVPLKESKGGTLVDWYEGQLMHRLDYETHGLVLFAKNQKSYEFFKALQDRGEFVKEYSAVCTIPASDKAPGFPPGPLLSHSPQTIMSYFRSYGPGRKQVRPVIDASSVPNKDVSKDKGGFYRTEITQIQHGEGKDLFTVRIRRGFRHQIRCHLAWIGRPIIDDPLYNTVSVAQGIAEQRMPKQETVTLALRAHALFFIDPSTGEKRESSIKPLNLTVQ